jgi:Uma2 family endonuclease
VGTMPLPEITWQDVQQLPDDGNRYEAIEGELYVTPAPSLRHQTISTRLFLELARLLVDGGHGRVWFAPVGVWNERRGILAPEGLRGAPDLVVEILSPTTASRDRGVKRTLYERQGVSEYWIVDHELEAVEVWRFDAEPRHERFVDRLPVRHAGEPIGEIDLTGVFAAD